MSMLRKVFDLFARLSCIIFIISLFYIAYFAGFHGNVCLSYVWGVLLVSFLLAVGRIPLMMDKECSKNWLLIGNIIYIISTNVIVLLIGYKLCWFLPTMKSTVIGMEICIVLVTVSTYIVMYFTEKSFADKMNQKLQNRLCNKEKEEEN